MRGWLALMPALMLLCHGGCTLVPEPGESASWLKRPTELAPNVVQLDVALIERPVGHPFLNKDLWKHTDEFVVFERRGVLEDNGFRVGQIVGTTPPAALQDLLTSERSCINPRRRLLPDGHSTLQILGPTYPRATFEIRQDKEIKEITLDQARFCLDVTAHLTDNGAKLVFTPKVENGEVMLPFEPDPDRSTWNLRVERPAKAFKALAWEVTLAPSEFLVIGAYADRTNTLGHRSFIQEEGPNPVQRLLVIRTARSSRETARAPTLEDLARAQRSPCLAEQATMSAIRASGQ